MKKNLCSLTILLFAVLLAGSAFAAAEFQIVSFELPKNLVSVDASGSVVVDAVVKIRNIGEDPGDATVEVVVTDAEGNEMSLVPAVFPASSSNLAAGATDEHSFAVTVLGSWEPGLYSFYANVDDGGPPLHGPILRTLTLAIIKPPPVPELPIFLVPLAAFSVLAFLFFSRKKHSNRL